MHPPVTELDLSVCEREPIHLLGSIQPHGVLLALSEPELTLRVVSDNTQSLLGEPAERLLGRTLHQVLPAELLTPALQALAHPGTWPQRLDMHGQPLTALVHHADGLSVLELERAPPGESLESALADMDRCLSPPGQVRGLQALLQWAAERVRALTGFDRVMVYRFDEDWHGEVVAESRAEGVSGFLGLHFPASDIPSQARTLYARNLLRMIADVGAEGVPLVPARLPELGRPLDLSGAALRCVSSVHLEYLGNMGVAASLSLSLLREGRLWGLIACHHRTPRYVPATVRRACELLVRLLALQLAAEERGELASELAWRVHLRARLLDRLASSPQALGTALARNGELLLQLTHASGAALLGHAPVVVGQTPPVPFLQELARWLAREHADSALFHTDRLGELHPPSAAWADVASGLLAVRLEPGAARYLMWFRPEVARTVSWAGDPRKPAQPGPRGSQRLQPRASFAEWKETVRGRGAPWTLADQEIAEGLRSGLVPVLLRQAETLARYNAELEAFSGTVAHDLKESLRGILWSTRLLKEEHGLGLPDSGLQRLREVEWQVERAQTMLAALLEYSRWDHVEQAWGRADMQEGVEDVLTSLSALYSQGRVEVRIPRRLPVVECDPVRVRQVWANLLSNAARYHQGEQRWVEVGYFAPGEALPAPAPRRPEEYVFYVRDNGIGIPEQFHESIFTMFRRLHPAHAYGGGSGAGLAIARRLVRVHGGELWLESSPGRGSTFYFTPGRAPG